jgi:hypothetical protein
VIGDSLLRGIVHVICAVNPVMLDLGFEDSRFADLHLKPLADAQRILKESDSTHPYSLTSVVGEGERLVSLEEVRVDWSAN